MNGILKVIRIKNQILLNLVFLLSNNLFAQIEVHNSISSPFVLEISCEERFQKVKVIIDNDSLFGSKDQYISISIGDSKLCDCNNLKFSLSATQIFNRLTFTTYQFEQFISGGGNLKNIDDPLNKYLFCACYECENNNLTLNENGCAIVEYKKESCVLELRNPSK